MSLLLVRFIKHTTTKNCQNNLRTTRRSNGSSLSTVVAVVIGSSRRQPLILSSSAKDEPYYQWSQRPVSNRCIPVSTHRRSITNVDNFVIGTNNTSIIKKLISTARAVGVDGGSSYYFSSSSASSSASSSSSSSTSPELLPLSSISSSSFQESSQILNVSCLADEMRQEVRNYTKSWTGRPLKLVGIISQTHQDDEHDDSSSDDDDDECRTSRNDTKTYAERIAEACKEDGIEFELIQYRQPSPTSFGDDDDNRTTTTVHEVESIIHHVNQRHDVDGILIFYPIFKSQQQQPQHQTKPQTNKFQSLTQQNSDSSSSSTIRGPYKNKSTGVYYMTYDDYLRDMVDPSKDVEGLSGDYHDRCSKLLPPVHPRTSTLDTTDGTTTAGDTTTSPAYSFLSKDDMILPCTALSIKHILDRHHHSTYDDGMSSESSPPSSSSSSSSLPPRQLWTGQTVSVVNRSKILGRPLATMLASSGANVYSIDVDTILQFQQSGTKRLSPPRGDGDDDHQEEEHTKSPPPSPAVPAAATSKSTAHTESDAETSSTTTKTTEHNLEWCLRQSSVVVTAVPDPNFELPCHVIAPGTTVVNVSEFDNVKEEQVLKQPGIKYIPKVGQVTVAVLEQNLIRLHYQKHQAKNVIKT